MNLKLYWGDPDLEFPSLVQRFRIRARVFRIWVRVFRVQGREKRDYERLADTLDSASRQKLSLHNRRRRRIALAQSTPCRAIAHTCAFGAVRQLRPQRSALVSRCIGLTWSACTSHAREVDALLNQELGTSGNHLFEAIPTSMG